MDSSYFFSSPPFLSSAFSASSMASIVASVPLPLPLDSLLASSWTWLALSLATIATLLRALSRISLCRLRRPALLSPPPSIFSVETQQMPSIISDLSRLPLQKHRVGCKSTPSLQAIVQSHGNGGLAYAESGFISCFGSVDLICQCLCKVVSTSDMWLRAEGAKNSVCSCDCKRIEGPGSGFLVDSQERVSRISTEGIFGNCGERHNAACLSPQMKTFSLKPAKVPPCFETQYGWSELLETKLGLHWHVQRSALSAYPVHIVKAWSIQERNLFDVLHLEGSSVGALDMDIAGGLACVAQINGSLSHWDVINQTCLSQIASDVDSVSTLCWNSELRFAVAGNHNVLRLWDFRSPNLMPIWSRNASTDVYANIQLVDNTFYIHRCSGISQFCDLRKLHVDCFTSEATILSSGAMVRPEAEWSLALWEKLSCNDDEIWDEPIWNSVVASNKSSNSFTSMCVSLVRSLSLSAC